MLLHTDHTPPSLEGQVSTHVHSNIQATAAKWKSAYQCLGKCRCVAQSARSHGRVMTSVSAHGATAMPVSTKKVRVADVPRVNCPDHGIKQVTTAGAESINSRIKMVKARSSGFRNKKRFKAAIYAHLADWISIRVSPQNGLPTQFPEDPKSVSGRVTTAQRTTSFRGRGCIVRDMCCVRQEYCGVLVKVNGIRDWAAAQPWWLVRVQTELFPPDV